MIARIRQFDWHTFAAEERQLLRENPMDYIGREIQAWYFLGIPLILIIGAITGTL